MVTISPKSGPNAAQSVSFYAATKIQGFLSMPSRSLAAGVFALLSVSGDNRAMWHFMITVVMTVLATSPGHAQQTVQITRADCQRLVKYQPLADVAY
jgi:hypothetical protein